MLKHILNIFGPAKPAPNAITMRLFPDAGKVSAGFSIWLRSLRNASDDPAAINAEVKAFWDELRGRGMEQNGAGIPLDSPFNGDISRQLDKWKHEPHFRGTATLAFTLRQDAAPGWEWYEIRPDVFFRPPLDSQIFTCRADLMPRNRHWYKNGFISEKCKTLITNAGLTGLHFNWVPDVGRYQAPQWFHAMATEPLGRGLDNPLAHPAKVTLPDRMKDWYSYEAWRFGQTGVARTNNVNGLTLGIPLADQIIGLSPSLEVSVNGFRQMLRQFLPATDFAYIWHWVPSMCCNARARTMLIQNGILDPSEFSPIWIWDTAPEGAVVLDDPNVKPIPPFPLHPLEWEEVQKQSHKKWDEYIKAPKPPLTGTFESVFQKFCTGLGKDSSRISNVSKLDPPNFAPASDDKKLPQVWERVLETSDDFLVNTDKSKRDGSVHGFGVIPKSQLAEFNKRQRLLVKQVCAGRSVHCDDSKYLHFAGSDGDSLSFDMSTLTDEGDCRVVEWRHDPLGMGREWQSIVHLLEESIELEEGEGSAG
jgi:hypothetical protein